MSPGAGTPPDPPAALLEIRPLRAADQDRVLELVADVWDGHDYIAEAFDRWIADPGAWFQGAELDGFLVGLQRLRPLGPGLLWYEGLRVKSSHRRQGIARRMLAGALAQALAMGFREIRLVTANPAARGLFESAGFRLLVSPRLWEAGRIEGGEPARIPAPDEAPALAEMVRADPALSAYGGVTADFNGARDLDAIELGRLAGMGRLRVGAGGRALAVIRPARNRARLNVTFLAGRGGALRDLLMALRVEADADDLEGVSLAAPPEHPAAGDLEAVGYDLRPDFQGHIYSLRTLTG
ncbi:MAG: GNAT family N-acetyltransferase [Candidatus Dormibacteraceae bacterium]